MKEKPKEIPTKVHPNKIKPISDPDLVPSKSNPINPKTDSPDVKKKEKSNIQDHPGDQFTG